MIKRKLILSVSIAFLVLLAFFSALLNPVLRSMPMDVYRAFLGDSGQLIDSDFKSRKRLEARLNDLLPSGSKTEAIDQILLSQEHFFRSDNLIKDHYKKLPVSGSSSAHNYLYYYKPSQPAGSEGWEDTSIGWVILAVVDGEDGLQSIRVLATPHDPQKSSVAKEVAFVKELLQYKNDQIPVDRFKNDEWEPLLSDALSSPCLVDFTSHCLIKQAFLLLGIPHDYKDKSAPVFLAEAAIRENDQEAGKILLSMWLTAEDVFAYENSIPRLRRLNDEQIDRFVRVSEYTRLQLLLLVDDYDQARNLLISFQEKYKTGSDYGAISLLVDRGQLDKALALSQLTLEWRPGVPDPNENSSAIMHCENYSRPVAKATAMGKLADAYIKAGRLDSAYEVAVMIRRYWENDAYGQPSHCYSSFAQGSYVSVMNGLIKSYAERDDKDRAVEIARELIAALQLNIPNIMHYNKWPFESTAQTIAANKLNFDMTELTDFAKSSSRMDYPEVYNNLANDPVPLIAALSGDYQRSITLIEDFRQLQTVKNKNNPLDLLDEASEFDVKLTTYMKTAKALADAGDKSGAILFLSQAAPYFGKREDKYNQGVARLSDYVTEAEILMEMGEKQKSRAVLDSILEGLNDTDPKDFRESGITANFFGQVMNLYVQHEHISAVMAWSKTLPYSYSPPYATRIGSLLAKDKRWDEFDIYMPEMADVLTRPSNYSNYTIQLTNALISAKEFDRYWKLIDFVGVAAEKNKVLINKNRPQSNFPFDKPEPKDDRLVVELVNNMLLEALISGQIPDRLIRDFWPRYLDNCKSGHMGRLRSDNYRMRYRADARDIMASCYVDLVDKTVWYRDMLERLQRVP